MSHDTPSSVEQLAQELDCTWPNILEARRFSRETRGRILAKVADLIPPDASLVVSGSLAREEATPQSDIDWSLLIDGQAHESHLSAALAIEDALIELKLAKPGAEGTFGSLVFSHELVHLIGGASDTNANTTRRLLLLLESAPIGPSEVRERVIHPILKRYITEDFGLLNESTQGVPRFLLNDVVRFWRTMAVDFAYKRRAQQSEGWALRTVKLRLSRKLTYVAGLLACYSGSSLDEAETPNAGEHSLAVVDRLARFLRHTPLEMLAQLLLDDLSEPDFALAARNLFDSYDAFVGILSDPSQRNALKKLAPEHAATSVLYNRVRELGHTFQEGLDTLFLEPSSTRLYRLTRAYGVF